MTSTEETDQTSSRTRGSLLQLMAWQVLLFSSCAVEPSVQPGLDASCERSDACSADGGADAGKCPLDPPDVGACDVVVPIGSDASLDPGDASCIHPPVVEDCVEGWCRIPAGCFTAGAPEDEACRGRYDDQVQVFITHPFLIMQTEVPQLIDAFWELRHDRSESTTL